MCLIGAVSPHYIIGIALGAGVYGFFMLCEGAFKVRDDIPPWFIWARQRAEGPSSKAWRCRCFSRAPTALGCPTSTAYSRQHAQSGFIQVRAQRGRSRPSLAAELLSAYPP